MDKHILVDAVIKYDISGSAFYCLSGCKYHRTKSNHSEYVYATCLLFGDFFRYINAMGKGRVALRHMACIECEKISDMFGGGRNA